MDLQKLTQDWKRWAAASNKIENGWESGFPDWDLLMHEAKRVMQSDAGTSTSFGELELCWAISEETEDLVDFAKQHLAECWPSLERLAESKDARVRWQVYEVFGAAGDRAKQ